jgi:hypothetical protein
MMGAEVSFRLCLWWDARVADAAGQAVMLNTCIRRSGPISKVCSRQEMWLNTSAIQQHHHQDASLAVAYIHLLSHTSNTAIRTPVCIWYILLSGLALLHNTMLALLSLLTLLHPAFGRVDSSLSPIFIPGGQRPLDPAPSSTSHEFVCILTCRYV